MRRNAAAVAQAGYERAQAEDAYFRTRLAAAQEFTGMLSAGLNVASLAERVLGEAALRALATRAAGGGADVVYHYTSEKAAAAIERTGLFSQSSATDVGDYTAKEAVELLGVKKPPEVVVEIRNAGQFVPNRPAIVQPHVLGPGGGLDLTNAARVPPECILCVRPVRSP
jgi:hypothetical protein